MTTTMGVWTETKDIPGLHEGYMGANNILHNSTH
jgi:hypothetical protein